MNSKINQVEKIVDPKKGKYIHGLESIRFFLALIVILSHFKNPWEISFKTSPYLIYKLFGSLIPNLFCGIGAVIAFFIVSGFVIHYPNKEELTDIKKFLIRRWLRIGLPLIAIILLSSYVLKYDTITTAAIPIWSLYCELIYYTIYPLLYKIKISWVRKFWISFCIASIIILFFNKGEVNSFIHQTNLGYLGSYWILGTLFTAIIGLPCWLLGVLLAEKVDQVNVKINTFKIYSLRLLVLTIGCVANISRFHLFVSFTISMNLFAFLLYYWLFYEINYYKNNKASPVTEKMGHFSYSLYLCHGTIYLLLQEYLPLNNYTYLIYITCTIFISYLFYLIIEKPSHQLARELSTLKV